MGDDDYGRGSEAGGSEETKEVEEELFKTLSWRILPVFCLYIFVGALEKANLSYASSGIMETIGINNTQYGLVGTVFIVAYAISTIPTVLLAKRVGAIRGLCAMMLSFGIVTMCTAAVQSFADLTVTRIFLGVTEAGVNQTMMYYLTGFYGQERLAMAMTVGWLLGGQIASTVGGLIAALILHVTGNWRYLFLLEGVLCFPVGILVLLRVPSSPAACSGFLRPNLNAYLFDYVEKEQERKKKISAELAGQDVSFLDVLKDKRVLLLAGTLFCWDVGYWGIVFWLPQVLLRVGDVEEDRSAVQVALLASIPNALASVASVLWAWNSDRTRERILHGVAGAMTAALGMAMAGAFESTNASSVLQVISLTVSMIGSSMFYSPFVAFQGDILPRNMSASGFAIVKAFGVSGGIVGPFMLGALKQVTGSFVVPMFILAGFYFICTFLFFQGRRFVTSSPPLVNRHHHLLIDEEKSLEGIKITQMSESDGTDPPAASFDDEEDSTSIGGASSS